MLPVYNAISFQGILEKGGRTKPWLVLAATPNGIKPFVVKMFETTLIAFRDSVTNEVAGNTLAKVFDLKTPKAALVDFSPEFISSIRNEHALEVLLNKDDRLKFATEFINPNVPFDNGALNSTEARKLIDIDTVFAFDYLIRNGDRTRQPPNVLISGDTGYVIDHELAFDITTTTASEVFRDINPRYEYHLFFKYLKNSRGVIKQDYFNEFEEYLRTINVNILQPFFNQLYNSGYSTDKHAVITNYLQEMKLKFSNFVKLMRALIA